LKPIVFVVDDDQSVRMSLVDLLAREDYAVETFASAAEVVESRARLAKLTPREFEVFRWIIAGLLNKEIGAEMGVTLRTIKRHRAQVMQKTGVVSVVELVRLALKAGIAPVQPGIASRVPYTAHRGMAKQFSNTD